MQSQLMRAPVYSAVDQRRVGVLAVVQDAEARHGGLVERVAGVHSALVTVLSTESGMRTTSSSPRSQNPMSS